MSGGREAKRINRAELIDKGFIDHVNNIAQSIESNYNYLEDSGLDAAALSELFESQMRSRQLDLLARELRLQNKVFYTIGSSGHEGNAVLGRLSRDTDPALLHYRSGAFMMERARKIGGNDPVYETALSFAASANDPASGGRHKVWGSRPLWVIPQTSTIASHLPKAVGVALGIAQVRRMGATLPVPEDSIVICSFGDASINHSTAQGAFNTAQWTAHQGLPVPILFVCEDNDWGISVRSPAGWVRRAATGREGIRYFQANGLDVLEAWGDVGAAVEHVRRTRMPAFLHLKVVRLMGHAGTDFEIEYRDEQELLQAEASDPLLRSAEHMMRAGLMSAGEIVDRYEAIREQCREAAERAHRQPKLETRESVMASLAPLDEGAVRDEAVRVHSEEARVAFYGGEDALPEAQPARHLAININRALQDLMLKYPEAVLFGEDVARKGGVYTVTRGLHSRFRGVRVFNTLLDEQTILGLAQGFALMGLLPYPEIQYLAYFHNACDQLRGEACSTQFFSNRQFANPMVVRIPGLGYQKGFGGHFHNDNSIAALRDIPGLIVGCPSRGDDAVEMLRTMSALAKVSGRVCVFLEPIALYMTKDLYVDGDGEWQFAYPPPDAAMRYPEPRVYQVFADRLLVITYGNGVPMALRAARRLEKELGEKVRVLDLRWLVPLNEAAILEHARQSSAVLVVDEGRASGGISEAVLALLAEKLPQPGGLSRVVGADCYTPLGGAAQTVLPSEDEIFSAARRLLSATD